MPGSLAYNMSCFKIGINMSFEATVAGLCGLSQANIRDALLRFCKSPARVDTNLAQLTKTLLLTY